MAKFSVCLLYGPGAHHHKLWYHVDMLRVGLLRCGHEVEVLDNSLNPARVNILVGSHMMSEQTIQKVVETKAKIVILQSEVFLVGSLFRKSIPIGRFFAAQKPLYDHALAIWECVSHTNAIRYQDLATQKVRQFRGGFDEQLQELTPRPIQDRDIDFCFYGTESPHRNKICGELGRRGFSVLAWSQPLPRPVRNDLLARTKVVLSPRWSDQWAEYFSWARCTYAWNQGLPVAAEQAAGSEEYDEMVGVSGGMQDFVDFCQTTLQNPNRLLDPERFRAGPSMKQRVEQMLAESL